MTCVPQGENGSESCSTTAEMKFTVKITRKQKVWIYRQAAKRGSSRGVSVLIQAEELCNLGRPWSQSLILHIERSKMADMVHTLSVSTELDWVDGDKGADPVKWDLLIDKWMEKRWMGNSVVVLSCCFMFCYWHISLPCLWIMAFSNRKVKYSHESITTTQSHSKKKAGKKLA